MEYTLTHISDLDRVLIFDEMHGTKLDRKNEIIRAIQDNSCYRISDANKDIGYGIFRKYGFLSEGFIELLVVHSGYRGRGYGESFMRYCEEQSETKRIHTSTNDSNLPMQNLLKKLRYNEGGRIMSFDPDDPEIFYYKKIE